MEGAAAQPLRGELVFSTVTERLNQAGALVDSGDGDLVMDLSGVTRTDSAGLALLLELTRRARARNRALRFAGAPEPLRRLAGFFGLNDILPLAE